MDVKLKYFWRNRHGQPNVRIKGRVYPIRDDRGIWHEPGTEIGDKLYWEILTGRRAAMATSWRALITDYRNSDRWTGLRSRTRADYEKVMLYLEDKIGTRDVRRLLRKDVIAAMNANRHRVRFANYIADVMVQLCEHAIDLGWLKDNPAKGIRRIKTPPEKARPHIPWPDWAVDKFRAEARPLQRLIFEIGVGSVQRPSDWLGFTWGDYDGDTLSLRQSKGDVPLRLPCTLYLAAALDTAKAALSVAPLPTRHILTKADGQPMDYHYMARKMLEERKRLGLEAFDLHALRYRGVAELALADCDDDEIASYSGHSTKAMIRKYAGEARQMMRARQAREKRQ